MAAANTIAFEARALSMPAAGVVRYVRGLLRAFAAQPTPPPLHVLVSHSRAVVDAAPFPVTVLPGGGGLSQLWWDRITLTRGLKQLRPSLVHLTKPSGLLPRSLPMPVLMTIHDIIPLTSPQTQTRAQRAYWTFHLPRAAARADHIVTISEWSKQQLCEHLRVSADRVTVIYPGIATFFAPASVEAVASVRQKYDIPDSYVLSVGTIEPRKNVDLLLRAFAQIAATVPHTLVIVGRWGWKTSAVTSALADPRLRGRVRVLGAVPSEDLPALYTGAHLFAFLSQDEGFGFPPLEAMACGTPVLVSNRGSLPEVVGPSAWITEPEEHGVAEQLRTLLAERPGLEHRAALRQWIQRFQWRRTGEKTRAVYDALTA